MSKRKPKPRLHKVAPFSVRLHESEVEPYEAACRAAQLKKSALDRRWIVERLGLPAVDHRTDRGPSSDSAS